MEASGATPAQMDIARFGIENARRVRVLGSGTFGCVTEVQYAGESYALKEAKTDAVSWSILGGLDQVRCEQQ